MKIVVIGGTSLIGSNATGDARHVMTDVHAPYYGTEVDERALIPSDNPRIGAIRFADWLSLRD